MNLFDPMHLEKEDIISSRFDIELQQNILLDIFCGSSSTLLSAFVLSCAAGYIYFFFLENTLYMYILNLITPIIRDVSPYQL